MLLGGVSVRFEWLAVAAITHPLGASDGWVCKGGATPKSLIEGPLRENR